MKTMTGPPDFKSASIESGPLRPNRASAPKRLVLTGFMGAGKTTVGGPVASALGWSFVDLDQEIVRAQGASIPFLFESIGEPAFRELERIALASALQRQSIVLALGGGAMESASSRSLLTGDPSTLLIYLEAPLEVLLARCDRQRVAETSAAHRPVLDDRDAIAERFLRRTHFYQAAHWEIATASRRQTEIAAEILMRWNRAPWKDDQPGNDDSPPSR